MEVKESNSQDQNSDWRSTTIWAFLVAFGLVSLFGFGATVVYAWCSPTSVFWGFWEYGCKDAGFGSGSFGDAFGAVTSAFTGLAFIGLLLAIYIQRLELSALRDDRDTGREALSNQTKVNKEILALQHQQVLEDRLFKLLDRCEKTIEKRQKENANEPLTTAEKLVAIVDTVHSTIAQKHEAKQLALIFCQHFDGLINYAERNPGEDFIYLPNDVTVQLAELIETTNQIEQGKLMGLCEASLPPAFDPLIHLISIRCDLLQIQMRTDLPVLSRRVGPYFQRMDRNMKQKIADIRREFRDLS